MDFNYNNISRYYDQNYWDAPGVKSGYTNMTGAIGGKWHDQACKWFNTFIPVKGKVLLDAGCGLGHFMVGFKKLGADVYGCDISDYSAEIVYPGFGNKFYQTSLEEMKGIPRDFFDIVFCASTMEHIPKEKVEQVFLKLLEVCKPWGIIYIEIDTIPNEQKPVPEASHINIRHWATWLCEINRPVYWWNHAFDIELQLREYAGVVGFPHPDWKFIVMRKFKRAMDPMKF